MAAKFTAEQYSAAMRALFPRGRAWDVDDGSVQSAVCDALTQSYERSDAAAMQMLADAFPATAGAFVPEWNATLQIPDPCFGAPTSVAQNRQQIVAKLIGTGGQSVPYFQQLAAALGVSITITEFSPTHTDPNVPTGMIQKPADWAYTWRVNVDRNSVAFLNVASPVNGALASPSLQALDCLLRRYKPAHTQFYYAFFTSTPTRPFDVADSAGQPLSIPL